MSKRERKAGGVKIKLEGGAASGDKPNSSMPDVKFCAASQALMMLQRLCTEIAPACICKNVRCEEGANTELLVDAG